MSQPKLDIVLKFGSPYEDTGLRLWADIDFCGKVLDSAQQQVVRDVFEKLPSCNDFTPDCLGRGLMIGTNEDRSTWPDFEKEVLAAARKHFNIKKTIYK